MTSMSRNAEYRCFTFFGGKACFGWAEGVGV